MVFAAPGVPLGRAADDDGPFAHLPTVNERMYARHEGSDGAAPVVIEGDDVGRWFAPLTKGEVQTWPNLIKQLRQRCFKPQEETSAQQSEKAWKDAAKANGVTDQITKKNAQVIKDVEAAIEATNAKAAEDSARMEAANAKSAKDDAQLGKDVADEAAKANGAIQDQVSGEGAAAAEQAGNAAAQAARAAEAKVRAEADAAADANAAAVAAAEAGAGAEAETGVALNPSASWNPSASSECRSWCKTNKARNGAERSCALVGCSQCGFCPSSLGPARLSE